MLFHNYSLSFPIMFYFSVILLFHSLSSLTPIFSFPSFVASLPSLIIVRISFSSISFSYFLFLPTSPLFLSLFLPIILIFCFASLLYLFFSPLYSTPPTPHHLQVSSSFDSVSIHVPQLPQLLQ